MRFTTWVTIAVLFAQSGLAGQTGQDRRRMPGRGSGTNTSPTPWSRGQTSDPPRLSHGHAAETNRGTPPCRYGDPGCGNSDQPPPPHRDDHTGRNVALGVGVGAVAGLIIAGAAMSHANNPTKTLSDHGPQFPDHIHMSTFQITGFVRGGWPLVVDYEAEAGTYAVLTVMTEGAQPFSRVLEVRPNQRQLVIMQTPPDFGRGLKIADFTIRATVSPRDDRLRYLRVYGFGCGPKAVGSVAIDQLRFGPQNLSSGQTDTQFSFHSHTDFEKISAEFMQVQMVDDCLEGVIRDKKSIGHRVSENDSVHETWNAKKVAQGQIQLRLRGWMTAGSGGDWVSAFSPDLVLKN